MQKLSEIEIRYRKKIFLQDDLNKQYVLFFNQEKTVDIIELIGKFKTHKLCISGEQANEFKMKIGSKVFTIKQNPFIYTLDLWKFYQFGLDRSRDWLMLTRKQYEDIAPTPRTKLIKRKRR